MRVQPTYRVSQQRNQILCPLLDACECLDSQEEVDAAQFHRRIDSRPDGHHQRYGKLLALLTEEVLYGGEAVLSGIVADHSSINVVVTLAKEHGSGACVAGHLPHWNCEHRRKNNDVKHKTRMSRCDT